MQEITRHLSDIEMKLSELGRKLEDVCRQIRDVSMIVRPKQEMAQPPLPSPPSSFVSSTPSALPSLTANPVRQASAEQTKSNRNRRQNQYTYGSTYRPDKWMNVSTSAAVTNGIQETWSVGDGLGSSYTDPYTDSYADSYTNLYTDSQADSYTDPYTGPYEGSNTGSYEGLYTGSYSESNTYGSTQNEYGLASSSIAASGNFARQSEYSIHARP